MEVAAAAVNAGRADDSVAAASHQTGDKDPVDDLNAFGFQRPGEADSRILDLRRAGT